MTSNGRDHYSAGGRGLNLMSWKTLNLFSDEWSDTARLRAGIFLSCVIIGLASGSNYVYSAYAPQLATELRVSSTVGNLIGLAGNLGVYLTGPLWGKLVDARGPKLSLFLGGLCCLIGYSSVHAFYVGTFSLRAPSNPSNPSDAEPDAGPTQIRLFFLLFAMFLTGCGGSSGLTSGVNATAKSFPDSTRASATGTVLAGFGLSAFLFSSLGHLVYKGDAGGLLALLAGGTGIPMLIGSTYIRPVPPHDQDEHRRSISTYERINNDDDDGPDGFQGDTHGHGHGHANQVEILIQEAGEYEIDDGDGVMSRSNSLELTRSRSPLPRGRHHQSQRNDIHAHFSDALPATSHSHPHSHSGNGKSSHARSSSLASLPPTLLAHTPFDLFRSLDFWILFVVLALLCGVGLMYINNAGTVALALGREGQRVYDKERVSGWQAKQVGLVSIWNCAGRIIGGVVSDFGKTKYHISRIWFLPVVAILFIISQVSALETTRVQSLWMVSSLLGLAYGSLFNVLPMLVLEWFGMRHFSQNWGWTAVAPILGSNGFNLLFGKVYDAHTIGRIGTEDGIASPVDDKIDVIDTLGRLMRRGGSAIPDDGKHDCLVGEDCYGTAFKFTLLGSVVALCLSVWAGVRRERYSRERRKAM
ncbi:hypothetical protein I316_04307 [Kwoniella heveanensis BCC8398]|uniref:Nodulin-like domain-containing protein n=1 Tax=Kwoniella heveanensis BCC8398 TaxID=1296120 RepID=A0A1B9GSF6_9TREE|nr:hypothetical protein I316_04307 [Kwoniella heveanensis BCC8398]